MAQISAAAVKELREKTNSGMMDCKKALEECDGNMEDAIAWLRKKGLATASKKSGRIASEGVVAICNRGNTAVILELNSETDFVAKNDKFQNLASKLAQAAAEKSAGSVEQLLDMKSPISSATVKDEIIEHIATIGENISLRRLAMASVSSGIVVHYIHNAIADGMGKIGVLVALESASHSEEIKELGKHIAMHIAAIKPESLSIEDLDKALIAKEKAIFEEQALASGKPAGVIEKMVEGRIRKLYEEVVLMEQVSVIDGKVKISQLLSDLSKKLGSEVKIKSFVRYALGEGIEKQESNFAAEVAAMVG